MNIKKHPLEKPLSDIKFYFEKRSTRDFTASDYQHFFDLLTQSKPYRVDLSQRGKIRARELLCFYLNCEGIEILRIASLLNMRYHTVRTYIRHVIHALAAKTIQEAMLRAFSIGLMVSSELTQKTLPENHFLPGKKF